MDALALYRLPAVAMLLSGVLFGHVMSQYTNYVTSPKRDNIWMRTAIMSIVVLSGVTVVLQIIPFLSAETEEQSSFEVLFRCWAHAPMAAITATVAGTVQLIYGWRIRLLTKNEIIFVLVSLLSILQWLAGISVTVIESMGITEPYAVEASRLSWYGLSILADSAITASLCTFLLRHRSQFASTNATLDRITKMSIQTGSLTTAATLIFGCLYLAYPTMGFSALNFCLSSLYTTSLLTTLLARDSWKATLSADVEADGFRVLEVHSTSTGIFPAHHPLQDFAAHLWGKLKFNSESWDRSHPSHQDHLSSFSPRRSSCVKSALKRFSLTSTNYDAPSSKRSGPEFQYSPSDRGSSVDYSDGSVWSESRRPSVAVPNASTLTLPRVHFPARQPSTKTM
ncbi:hypothetical protein PLICRDRAFT_697799 [Plicaturopsis crispa FD-325 SS-3]|nr:hypothetical protein PLICRDRAFT_697799 [Plicaturopsis crispa FD-325 SS-3]